MGVTYGTFQARRRDGGAAEKRHMRCGRGRDVTEADMPRHELCFLRYLNLMLIYYLYKNLNFNFLAALVIIGSI